ncbi:MAG: FAD-dependent oxidoreductase [Ignavibacteriaceae bacterium]|nr:FAD-dependent oxidoreductase [Ignavibacteriaceae bacterium]
MKKTVIIGGGVAGLSAAVHLLRKGIKPLILESTKKAGGRTTSFFDPDFNSYLDNGQHILMGCYKETLSLYTQNQIDENFHLQKSLRIIYSEKKRFELHAPEYFYPLNLAIALFRYKPLSFIDAVAAGIFMKRVFLNLVKNPSGKNVLVWLKEHGQNNKLITYLWEPLIIGAMNTTPEKADAAIFKRIIKEIFFTSNFSTTIIIPKHDLLTSLILPLLDTIISAGGQISYSAQVTKLIKSDRGFDILLKDGQVVNSESIIMAVPGHALEKIELPEKLHSENTRGLTYSTILSVHLKVREFHLKEDFVGFHNSPVHWVFNKGSYLSVVISDADDYKENDDKEILNLIISELLKNDIIVDNNVLSYRIIKEKRATFVPDCNSLRYRASSKTLSPGIYLAGDWTDTGLPATIEGAALSGRIAADAIYEQFNQPNT